MFVVEHPTGLECDGDLHQPDCLGFDSTFLPLTYQLFVLVVVESYHKGFHQIHFFLVVPPFLLTVFHHERMLYV